MGRTDPRVDAYISGAAEFAKPILAHIRAVVHESCPEVVETTKWGAPHFDYKGMMCSMAAFREHCAFGFWKGSLVLDAQAQSTEAAGQFGRITKVSDLPSRKVMTGYIRKAMALNDAGRTVQRVPKAAKEPIRIPADFSAAVRKNRKAKAAFETFSPSHRREYLEWITGAKSDETRKRRLEQAIRWLAEGKPRNWKYTPQKSAKARAVRA